jgi:uncharacterized membrane protein YdbT with pleckstrin-like domain
VRYLAKVIQPGETVKHDSRVHWIVYLPGAAWLVLAVAGFLWSASSRSAGPVIVPASVFIVALGLIALLRAWIRRATTEIVVTDKRVIFKRGLIRRHTVEMNMDKVESVDVEQSVLGRILDYGTVLVRGTGAGIEPLYLIDSPLAIRNAIIVR